jgi:hypothetical protein
LQPLPNYDASSAGQSEAASDNARMWNDVQSNAGLHLSPNAVGRSGQINRSHSTTLGAHEDFQFGGQNVSDDLSQSGNTGNIGPEFATDADPFSGLVRGASPLQNWAESHEEPFSLLVVRGTDPGTRLKPQPASRPLHAYRVSGSSKSLPDSGYGSNLYPLSHDGSSSIGRALSPQAHSHLSPHLSARRALSTVTKPPRSRSEAPSQPAAPTQTSSRPRSAPQKCSLCPKQLSCPSDFR